METKKAMFGAGCFWGVETAFRKIDGVVDAACGYSGGTTANPDYKTVCSGRTGHAEVVEVEFDPEKVGYEQIVDAFWKMHDPTQLNRQGPDIGSQYRSAIFYYDESQAEVARESKKRLEAAGIGRPIVTEITPAGQFYRAEEYHQRYFEKNGGGACHF